MPLIYLVVGLVLLALLFLVSMYNKFVSMKTQIEASIQDIGNQLKRQADLIPNLEASAKGYLRHERKIYDSLVEARKAVESAVKSQSSKAIEAAEGKISAMLPKLQVLIESNPELKGADVVTKLMNELRDTADKLMYARRTTIDLVQDFNQMLLTFPSNVIAGIFGMTKQQGLKTSEAGEHMEVSEKEMKSPEVDLE